MKSKKQASRFALVILVLAAISAVVWVANRGDGNTDPRLGSGSQADLLQSAPIRPPPPGQPHEPTRKTERTESAPADGNSFPNATTSEKEVVQDIESLLTAQLGRITEPGVRARLRAILELPDALSVLRHQLREGTLPQRLLSVYALIEANGLTEELLSVVLSDPSPYVRAEALHWLFCQGDFNRVEQILQNSIASLDWQRATELLELGETRPTPDLPVALGRLHIGEGFPLYLNLLAERSPSIRLAAFTRLQDPSAPGHRKSLMLGLVGSSTPEAELVQRLKQAYQNETNPAARLQIAQHIAARTSQNDSETVEFLNSGLPTNPEARSRMNIRYREARVEQLRDQEQHLASLAGAAAEDPRVFIDTLRTYLELGEITGLDSLSKETLNSSAQYLRSNGYIYAPDIVARAEYVARHIK